MQIVIEPPLGVEIFGIHLGDPETVVLRFSEQELKCLRRATAIMATARDRLRGYWPKDNQGNVWYDYETWDVDHRLGCAEAFLEDATAKEYVIERR